MSDDLENTEAWWAQVYRLRAAIGTEAFVARAAVWYAISGLDTEQIRDIADLVQATGFARSEFWERLNQGDQ